MSETDVRDAIPPHETEVVDQEWDGPAAEERIPNDAGELVLRQAFAWVDPEGDPDTKAAYRFIHHEVSGEGQVQQANRQALVTSIGILNGGRGVDVLEQDWANDRREIYEHMESHLQDGGFDVPELVAEDELNMVQEKEKNGEFSDLVEHNDLNERRNTVFDAEIRATDDEDDEDRQLEGLAAVFDSPTRINDEFREVIRPGAFSKTLTDGADVRFLLNHDPNFVFGRTRSGTLQLEETEEGLRIENEPPNAQWARDIMASIERGDIDQMSFGFRAVEDRFTTDENGTLREILEAQLFDVSAVTFPAYDETNIELNNDEKLRLKQLTGIDFQKLHGALVRSGGREVRLQEDRKIIGETISALRDIAEPSRGGHSEIDRLRRELELTNLS